MDIDHDTTATATADPTPGRQRRKNPVNIDAPEKFVALCTLIGRDPAVVAQTVLRQYAEAWAGTVDKTPVSVVIEDDPE